MVIVVLGVKRDTGKGQVSGKIGVESGYRRGAMVVRCGVS